MRTINLLPMVALLLLPAAGMSQGAASGEELHREWVEVQTAASRHVRKDWWQALDLARLNAFIEAGVDIGVADKGRWTPLHSAARYNPNPDVLAALIRAGAIVDARNSSGDTPLHWAARENPSVDIINTLINAGANVNARDNYGWLPIHTAAEGNSNPDVVNALLSAGAERNKRAYYIFFRPVFLLKHNSNMSEADKNAAIALFEDPA